MATRFLALALLGVAAFVYWGGQALPASTFEPLGPGAFPRALAMLLALLSVLLLFTGVEDGASVQPKGDPGNGEDVPAKPQPLMAILLVAGAIGLATVMQMRVISFSISATVFLVVIMTILTRFKLKAIPATLVVAPVTGFGLEYLFTRVFVIYLP